jgi:hypothetical protein
LINSSSSWKAHVEGGIPTSKPLFASTISLLIILISASCISSLQHAYSQIESTPDSLSGGSGEGGGSSNISTTGTTLNASDLGVDDLGTLEQQQPQPPLSPSQNNNTNLANVSSTTSEDFLTLREQYLSSWEGLGFSSSFDTFLADCFIPPQGYGAYNIRASNIFGTDETICLYVEPVGFGYQEFIDQQGNPLYQYNITTDVTVSDRQGNPMGNFTVSFEPDNSYRKVTELFLVVEISQFTSPIPIGEYTVTYHFTDGIKGESFDLVKDFRIGEIAEVR